MNYNLPSATFGICISSVMFILLALSGCATAPTQVSDDQEPDLFDVMEDIDADENHRGYVIFGNKRFLTGPYGDAEQVRQIAAAIKEVGVMTLVSNRALQLPNKSPNINLKFYNATFPAECGGHEFHVYEGPELLILQYDYKDPSETNADAVVEIRDYIIGPNNFVEAGLWGPYDHTSRNVLDMCILPGDGEKDGMGLMDGNYEIGWVTTLAKWRQAELGVEYKHAVQAASACIPQLIAQASQESDSQGQTQPLEMAWDGGKQYRVQSGDTLSTIAAKVYGDASTWERIYEHNQKRLNGNPNVLEPGTVLEIP